MTSILHLLEEGICNELLEFKYLEFKWPVLLNRKGISFLLKHSLKPLFIST